MKFCFPILGFTLVLLAPFGLPAQEVLYNRSIFFLAPTSNEALNKSVEDLQRVLSQATGKEFTVSSQSARGARGIHVELLQKARLQPAQEKALQAGGIEDFVLSGDETRLLITATHPLGLSRGIYSYLDNLGVKWYLPGDEWTVIPSLSKLIYKGEKFVSPAMEVRDFFGTGDLAPLAKLDPSWVVRNRWYDWKRRNRVGGAYTVAGHYGEVFNDKYKAELERHPEYLAQVGGKRVWQLSSKWCVSNEGFRRLFIEDRVQALKQALAQSRYSNEKIVLSVDPSDAYGDCECSACRRMGTPSDRDFFLGNETVNAFQKISPRGYASIFAYSTHAAPPRIALNNHLIVYLVPYAFQNIGTPDELIAQWKKRHNNLAMYDYYGVTDWHWNTPLSAPYWSLTTVLSKLKTWQKDGFKAFLFESSFSAGSTGLGLYLLNRLGWNSGENTTALEQLFYRQLFGKAATQAALYFQKLHSNFKGAADLPYLIDLLEKAGKAEPQAAVQKRLIALKSYVHFLVLYYQQLQTPTEQLKTNLFDYALQLHFSGMVHSTRIAELLMQQQPAGSAIREKWNLQNPAGRVATIEPITDKKIQALFEQDKTRYPLLEGFEYQSEPATVQYELGTAPVAKGPMGEGMMILDWPETYVRASGSGKINLFIKVNERSENNESQRFAVQLIDTTTGKVFLEKTISINRNWLTLELSAPAGKTYRLISKHTNWIRLAVPQTQWLAFQTIPTYADVGRLWFYNNTDFLYYNNTAKDQPVFNDARGNKVVPEKVNELGLYRLKLSGGKKQWWTIEGTAYQFLRFHRQHLLFFPNPGVQAKPFR